MAIARAKAELPAQQGKGPPRGMNLVLEVKDASQDVFVTYDPEKVHKIARIIQRSNDWVTQAVIKAITHGEPVVLTSYQNRDVAETILGLVRKQLPIITPLRHSFELIDMT